MSSLAINKLQRQFNGLSTMTSSNGAIFIQQTTSTVTKKVVKQLRHYINVFDVSGSMSGGKTTAMVEQFLEFNKQVLKPYDSITVIVFDHEVRMIMYGKRVREVDFTRLVGQIQSTGGGTALYDAVHKGVDIAYKFQRKFRTAVTELVVFTDGEDQHSSLTLHDAKAKVSSPGVSDFHMVAMVVGRAGIPAMKAMCKPRHAHLISSENNDASGIRSVFGKMTKVIKKQITTVTTLVAVPATMMHHVAVSHQGGKMHGGVARLLANGGGRAAAPKKTCNGCGGKVGKGHQLCKRCKKGPTFQVIQPSPRDAVVNFLRKNGGSARLSKLGAAGVLPKEHRGGASIKDALMKMGFLIQGEKGLCACFLP